MPDDTTPPADKPLIQVPEVPIQMHIFEELPPKTDNRGFTIIERRTVSGLEPAGFVRFVGRTTILLPVPDPNSPQGFAEVPQQVQVPIDATTWQEAFQKSETVLPAACQKVGDRHMARMRGQEQLISVARTIPKGGRKG
jgi:hypothetical protein